MSDIKNIVISENASQVEKFAAKELSEYLALITSERISIKTSHDKNSVFIGCLPDGYTQARKECLNNELKDFHKDGFIIRDIGDNLIIIGKTPRATLYGVYRYLEMLGTRWYFPGKENEFVPQKKQSIYKKISI